VPADHGQHGDERSRVPSKISLPRSGAPGIRVGLAAAVLVCTAAATVALVGGGGSLGSVAVADAVAAPLAPTADPAAASSSAAVRSAASSAASASAASVASVSSAAAAKAAADRSRQVADRSAAAQRAARDAARDPRSAARTILGDYGFSSGQFSCLDALWTKESGWDPTASNPSSGAFGIPQALPGGKMSSAGADWRTNPVTQIRWGLQYIRDSYGSPCSAWAHSQAMNWY